MSQNKCGSYISASLVLEGRNLNIQQVIDFFEIEDFKVSENKVSYVDGHFISVSDWYISTAWFHTEYPEDVLLELFRKCGPIWEKIKKATELFHAEWVVAVIIYSYTGMIPAPFVPNSVVQMLNEIHASIDFDTYSYRG